MIKEELLELADLLERFQSSEQVEYGSVVDKAITVLTTEVYDIYDQIKDGVN